MARAQRDGELREIVVPGPALRDVRHDGLQVVGIAREVHVAKRQEVGGARLGRLGKAMQGAAVRADLVVRHHNQRLVWQAVRHRRQIRVSSDLPIQVCD